MYIFLCVYTRQTGRALSPRTRWVGRLLKPPSCALSFRSSLSEHQTKFQSTFSLTLGPIHSFCCFLLPSIENSRSEDTWNIPCCFWHRCSCSRHHNHSVRDKSWRYHVVAVSFVVVRPQPSSQENNVSEAEVCKWQYCLKCTVCIAVHEGTMEWIAVTGKNYIISCVYFHSVHQLYAINPAWMEVFAPSQIAALVLPGGEGVHVVKVCECTCTQHMSITHIMNLHTQSAQGACTGQGKASHDSSLFLQCYSHLHFSSDVMWYNGLLITVPTRNMPVTLNFILCVAWILLSSRAWAGDLDLGPMNHPIHIYCAQHLHSQCLHCSHHCSAIRLKNRLNKIKLLYIGQRWLLSVVLPCKHASSRN